MKRILAPLATPTRAARAALLVVALVLGVISSRVYDWATPDGAPRIDGDGCVLGEPLEGVYVAPRLRVLARCVTASGLVHGVSQAEDGDVTFDVALDAGQEHLLNAANYMFKSGRLHIEVIPLDRDRISLPRNGERVRVTGVWVADNAHGGHNEIHPATLIEID